MSDPTTKSVTQKFEWTEKIAAETEAHLKNIEKNVNEQQGKKGFNPYIWLCAEVNPLVDRLIGERFDEKQGRKVAVTPERTEELYKAIMALPLTPPKPRMSEDTNPTEYNIRHDKPLQSNLGLNLPQKNP